MDKSRLLAKARKLSRLLRATKTKGEAEAAAFVLAKMIDRYRIDEASLQDPAEDRVFVLDGDAVLAGKALPMWKQQLLAFLSVHYGVLLYKRCRRLHRRARSAVHHGYFLCGRAQDVAMCRHMYAWLSAEAFRLGRRYLKEQHSGRRAACCWRLGFVHGIAQQMRAARKSAAASHPAPEQATKALVALEHRRDDAKDWFEHERGKLPTRNLGSAKVNDPFAYFSGASSGEAFHLGASLPSSQAGGALDTGEHHENCPTCD